MRVKQAKKPESNGSKYRVASGPKAPGTKGVIHIDSELASDILETLCQQQDLQGGHVEAGSDKPKRSKATFDAKAARQDVCAALERAVNAAREKDPEGFREAIELLVGHRAMVRANRVMVAKWLADTPIEEFPFVKVPADDERYCIVVPPPPPPPNG